MLSAIILVSAMAQFSNFDQLSMVREFPGKAGKNTFLQSHDFNPATPTACIGSIKASDVKFQAFGGKNPVRFFFAADREGDGVEEIIVVRESLKTHQMTLGVYATPLQLGKKAKLIASSKKKDLGVFTGPGKIVAMGAIAVDDLPGDEVMIINEAVDGSRSLTIRKLPPKKNSKLGFPIRSDLTFGNVLTDEYMFLQGENVDEDPEEEIVCLRRAASLPDQLLAFDAPASLFAETGTPVRSDTNVNAVDGAENIGIGFLVRAGLLQQNLIDKRYLAFYRKDANGNIRVDGYDPPTGIATDLGAIKVSDQSLDPGSQDIPEPIALTSIRKTNFKSNSEYLDGDWSVEFTIDQGAGPETLGPFAGMGVTSDLTDTGGILFFEFKQFDTVNSVDQTVPVAASFNSYVTGTQVTWAQLNPKARYYLPAGTVTPTSGIDVSGFVLQLNHPAGTMTHTVTQMVIAQTGTSIIGELRDLAEPPVGGTKIADVISYRYRHDKP